MKLKTLAAITVYAALNACQAPESKPETTVRTDTSKAASILTDSSAAEYAVDTVASSLEWKAQKVVGAAHNGTIGLKQGTLAVEYGNIIGGVFLFNINSLKVNGLEGADQQKLTQHLLSKDFFDAAKNPTAKFDIVSIAPYSISAGSLHYNDIYVESPTHSITGSLTLCDSVKNVSFPARISYDKGTLTAEAKFNINRMLWGLRYGSERSLGDKMIKEDVRLQFKIVANKSKLL